MNPNRTTTRSYRERFSAFWRSGIRALVLAAAWSCQSYEQRPLLLSIHQKQWHARTLAKLSLKEAIGRIGHRPAAPLAEFDVEDGLTVTEGELVALVYNPALRRARLRVGRAGATREHAGIWSDPQLGLDVLRIAENVSDPWVIGSGLSISIPVSGRLTVEEALADASLTATQQRLREAEWTVVHEVRRAWFEWSAARLRVEETGLLVQTLQDLVHQTSELAELGEMLGVEAALFEVEQTRRNNELLRLQGDADAAEQALRSLLGLPPEAVVKFLPLLAAKNDLVDPDLEQMAGFNPTLVRLRQDYDVAEQSLRREIRKQYPDFTIGPAFESDQGQSRFGFLGVIPLPFWNANRQAIAEARADRELARARYETEYELLTGRAARLFAKLQALTAQERDMQVSLVPLVDQQLADALDLLRLGESSGLVLLQSLTQAHETKQEYINTRLAAALTRTRLEQVIGPPAADRVPVTREETQ